VSGWSPINERRDGAAVVMPKGVFDRMVGAGRAPVRENVGPDLRQRDLEAHEVAVVLASTSRLTQPFNGFMKRLQSLIKMAERGMELK